MKILIVEWQYCVCEAMTHHEGCLLTLPMQDTPQHQEEEQTIVQGRTACETGAVLTPAMKKYTHIFQCPDNTKNKAITSFSSFSLTQFISINKDGATFK